jgi:S1-C subfamily serine protease
LRSARPLRRAACVVFWAAFASTVLAQAQAVEEGNGEEGRVEGAIVSIEVTSQRGDWFSPWQSQRSAQSSGSGFIIAGPRVMTNAHVVSDARQIIVRRSGEPTPYVAEIEFIGHDSDLALLRVDDPEFARGVQPLALGDLPSLRSRVRTYGFPAGGDKLSRTEGVVSRVQFITYLHTGVDSHLGIQTDSAINPGNSGGPVIQDGRVVGVAFQTNTRLSGVGFFIPTPVIKRFLRDVEDGRYNGFGDLGLSTSNLLNPMYRELLEMPPGMRGVVVDRVLPGSSTDGVVRPDDVVLEIDGHPVRADGTIQYHGYALGFEQIAEEKQLGESVSLALWRKGARVQAALTLQPHPDAGRIRGEFDRAPSYFVYAGLVFMPLNQEYINTFGNYWQTADKHLLYALFFKSVEHPETNGQASVVLTRVLPHPVNSAYRDLSNSIVGSVNGVKIRQLSDLERAFAASTGPYHTIVLKPGDVIVVLDKELARRSHGEILARYGIAKDRRLP